MASLGSQRDGNGGAQNIVFASTGTVKMWVIIPEMNRKKAHWHGLLKSYPFPKSALDLTYHLERAAKHTGIKKVVNQVSEFKRIFICNIDIALKCDYLKVLKYQNLITLR